MYHIVCKNILHSSFINTERDCTIADNDTGKEYYLMEKPDSFSWQKIGQGYIQA